MWGHQWDSLMDIVWDEDEFSFMTCGDNDFTNTGFSSMNDQNYSVVDMVKIAESLYTSMGKSK